MTVTNVPPVDIVVATAGQTVFIFNFPILNATDFKAYIVPAGGDPRLSRTPIASNTYTLAINPDNIGGTMTLNVARGAGDWVTMRRDMPNARDVTYTDSVSIPASSLNLAADSDVLMVQQNTYAALNTSLRYDYNALAGLTVNRDMLMPILGAGQSFRKNAGNSYLEAYDTDAGITEITGTGIAHVTFNDRKVNVHVEVPEDISSSPFVANAFLKKFGGQFKPKNCSCSQTGIGTYTVTFSTPLTNGLYCVTGNAQANTVDPTVPATFGKVVPFNRTNTGFSFYTMDGRNQRRNFDNFDVIVTGVGAFQE